MQGLCVKSGAVRMQIANVKHSHCEAKLGFRVWETKFGCVHRKTAPTGSGGRDGYFS